MFAFVYRGIYSIYSYVNGVRNSRHKEKSLHLKDKANDMATMSFPCYVSLASHVLAVPFRVLKTIMFTTFPEMTIKTKNCYRQRRVSLTNIPTRHLSPVVKNQD